MNHTNSVTRNPKAIRIFYSSLLLLICLALTACEPEDKISNEAIEVYDVGTQRFNVYKTENFWNLLLLDTQTGRLWQIQYSTDNDDERVVLPISTEVLANGKNGRFTLTKTENMWTFILLDTKDGRLWQCQFSTKDGERLCIPINLHSKEL